MIGGYQILDLKTELTAGMANVDITNEEDVKNLKEIFKSYLNNELKPLLLRFKDMANLQRYALFCFIKIDYNVDDVNKTLWIQFRDNAIYGEIHVNFAEIQVSFNEI